MIAPGLRFITFALGVLGTVSAAPFASNSSISDLTKRTSCKKTADCSQNIPSYSHHFCHNNVCTFACNTNYVVKNGACVKAASSTCSKTADCSQAITANSHRFCSKGACTWACNSNYVASGSQCVKQGTKTKTTTAPAKTAVGANAVKAAGVTGFQGTNSGIGSWFHTNSAQDSTNGHSWCGFPYDDNVPGFAPSVGTMLRNFGNNYQAAGTAYCGLEARFTAPDGATKLLYIADGFDDKWVRTPGSVDIVYGSFASLFGRQTNNKNDVIQNLKWEFTGNRNERYKFKGEGSG